MKLTELLDQIDRLDQEATTGPWHEDGDEVLGDFYEDHGYLKAPVLGGFYQNECDAEFIALARTALPKLAEAVYHVLELHKPRSHEETPDDLFCNICGNYAPCETFIAITDVMEGDE